LGLRAATLSVFSNSARQICSWHKQQNFKKNLIHITRMPKNKNSETDNKKEKEKRKELYDELITVPYCVNMKLAESILKKALNSPFLSEENKSYIVENQKNITSWCVAFKKYERFWHK